MSFHSAALTASASARLALPAGEIPNDIWLQWAKIQLLEPEPLLLAEWMRALAGLRLGAMNRTIRPWNVLRVSPNMERKVCEALGPKTKEIPHGAGLRVYVPVEKYRPKRTWRSRTRPLIPGYIFADLPDEDALDTARQNYAVRDIMCLDGKPLAVPAIAIGAMILMEAFGEFDTTWNSPAPIRDKSRGRKPSRNWKHGELVKVTEGPFAGFMAEIVKAERADRIEVLVSLFGRETPTELDEEMIEPLDRA
jgi:transcriptional antiterminator RfaH